MKTFILKLIWTILQAEAKIVLLIKRPKIVAVTGSFAKTTTKDAIFWILRGRHHVWKSPGNLNAEIGIPLTILGYRADHSPAKWLLPLMLAWGAFKVIVLLVSKYPRFLIIEMGVEHQGDMKSFTCLTKPNIGVITAIGPAHLKNFGDIEGIFEEKKELIKSLPKKGWAVLNRQDKYSSKIAKITRAQVRYFDENNDKIAIAAAKAVGEILGVSNREADNKLRNFKMPASRLNIIKTSEITILDDSYNCNPLSAKAALSELGKVKNQRKVVILGDMLELGKYTKKAHQEIGELAAKTADVLVFVGEFTKYYQAGAKKINQHTLAAKDKEAAMAQLKKVIKPGDFILVKGSRKVGLEKVVNYLRNTKVDTSK